MKRFITRILIVLLLFGSIFNIIGINYNEVFADDESEYVYLKAIVRGSQRMVFGGDGTIDYLMHIGDLEDGQEIRVYYEKSVGELGWYFDVMENQDMALGVSYLYKLTQSYTLTNGAVAPANSYVQSTSLEIIGEEDPEDIKEDEGANIPPQEVETIDDILNKEWYDIPKTVWQGGGGVSTMEQVEKLYNKLMAVDYENLPDDKKQYYLECSANLRSTIVQHYSTGETDAWVENLQDKISGDKPMYTNPLFGQSGQTAEDVTPDKIIGDAETFVQDGQNSSVATINQTNADTALNSIYNILLAIAISITVIWGLVIAIKLMMSSVEEKAEYKQMLWPYLIGCIIIFGSFIIWRIIIIVMNNVL